MYNIFSMHKRSYHLSFVEEKLRKCSKFPLSIVSKPFGQEKSFALVVDVVNV